MTTCSAFVSSALFVLRQRAGDRDKGASLVEYGLIITFIAMVVFAALLLLGPQVKSLYTGATSVL
ncbi:MAG: hypothetical protein M0Z51_10705 [Propionibacterium sp.]|nr:hypothetical protein [Propionibacterium sp.]